VTKKTLGKIERVDVRDVWTNEAADFTPWLASEEGLKQLGEALGMDLEVEATEQEVGPFSADILAKRTDTPEDHWVVIENQLAKTDHRHLGQLLTYAAGLKTATVVWVATEFTDEHRAALDWLNEVTHDRLQFFGLEIELWRIGSSDPAPMFNVVSAPNEATSAASVAKDSLELSSLSQMKRRYWEAFRALLLARKSPAKPPKKAPPEHWFTFAIGRSNFWVNAVLNTKDNTVGIEFCFNGPLKQAWFNQLLAKQTEIEAQLGMPVVWSAMENKKSSRIATYRDNTDPTDEAQWPTQHAWLADTMERFQKVFRPRVQALPGPKDAPADDQQAEPPEVA
jgi:hypothetical protein